MDEVLAAAGCSGAQAEQVLEQVAARTATGHAAWAAKGNAVGEARAA